MKSIFHWAQLENTVMLIHAGIQEDGFLVVLQESEGAEKKSKIFCWGNTSSGLKILGKLSQREGDQDPKHTLASWRSVSVSLVHKREAVSEALTCIAYVLAGNWKQRPQDLTEISIRPCHGLSELFIFGHVCSWDNRGSSHLQLYPRATTAPFILKVLSNKNKYHEVYNNEMEWDVLIILIAQAVAIQDHKSMFPQWLVQPPCARLTDVTLMSKDTGGLRRACKTNERAPADLLEAVPRCKKVYLLSPTCSSKSDFSCVQNMSNVQS